VPPFRNSMKKIIIDTECYKNFFLLAIMDLETEKVRSFRLTPDEPFDSSMVTKIMQNNLTISFNGQSYDLPLITAAVQGTGNQHLKNLSDKIIQSKMPWQVLRDTQIRIPSKWNHIDLINIAPGQASLKIYGGRLNLHTLQDLPYEPDMVLSPEQMAKLEDYCVNDLKLTAALYQALLPQIKLRQEMSCKYNLDLRSKSDAQIAEKVLTNELQQVGVTVKKPGQFNPGDTFKYNPPKWLRFDDQELKRLLSDAKQTEFTIKQKGGVGLPVELGRKVKYNGAEYKVGIGGLHSCEKKQAVKPGADEVLFDADFASFYPSIILLEGYFPRHLTPKFLEIYRSIVNRRLEAKSQKDTVTANSLKIVINASFGKFGNKYSVLYSPELLISVTLTGQLALLMLIEQVTQAGAQVVSANTDGLVILSTKEKLPDVRQAMFDFELTSGFFLEENQYQALFSESVNNYLAIKSDGSAKGKGTFAKNSLSKNPQFPVCAEAVQKLLTSGIAIENTINCCEDIKKFISLRTVGGGAIWQDQKLGKVVRWYISTESSEPILYQKNGNKVPRTDRAVPLMTLPGSVPEDLDRDFYINESHKLLKRTGFNV